MAPFSRKLFAGLALAAAVPAAFAQGAFPSKPVTFIVPYEAGGASDINARLIGEQMAKKLGQNVVIENRPGATGLIGLDAVARSQADGHTVGLLATPGMLGYFSAGRPFEMGKTLAGVGQMYSQYTLMVVNHNLPEMANVRDLRQFLAYAKANPDKTVYTSIGPASVGHLTMERVLRMAGLKIEHIPYKGQTPALNDVMAGRVPMMSGTLSISSFAKDGRVRAIAVAAPKRAAEFPDVPTVIEQGFPNVVGGSFVGVATAPGVPEANIRRLAEALRDAVGSPEFAKRMTVSSSEPEYLGPAEFTARVNRDNEAWTQVLKDTGIKP